MPRAASHGEHCELRRRVTEIDRRDPAARDIYEVDPRQAGRASRRDGQQFRRDAVADARADQSSADRGHQRSDSLHQLPLAA
jgi:hypothetical protein